jgi:lysophospholipase L1-like esterase
MKLGRVIAALLVATGGVLNCAGPRPEPRRLPEDRTRPLLYVALGDSTVEGIGASRPELNYVSRLHERLRSVYPQARMVNLGVGGATAADVVNGQLQRAIALRPDLVTLSVGPNDITRGRAIEAYERDVETVFRALLQETTAVLVVNLNPDLTITPRFRGRGEAAEVGQRVVRFNKALQRQARAYGVEVVDLYTPSQEEVPRDPELIARDGYHPSDHGYARWAELMWRGVAERIGR